MGGYTGVSWKDTANGSADDGLTVTSNVGDTTKTLFIPNAGSRHYTSGVANGYGERGTYWSTDQYPSYTANAWDLRFNNSGSAYTSGFIGHSTKFMAFPLRCVRS